MKNVCFRSTHYKDSQILTLGKILWAWKVFSNFEEPKTEVVFAIFEIPFKC